MSPSSAEVVNTITGIFEYFWVMFQPAQDFKPAKLRQLEVEQNKDRDLFACFPTIDISNSFFSRRVLTQSDYEQPASGKCSFG